MVLIHIQPVTAACFIFPPSTCLTWTCLRWRKPLCSDSNCYFPFLPPFFLSPTLFFLLVFFNMWSCFFQLCESWIQRLGVERWECTLCDNLRTHSSKQCVKVCSFQCRELSLLCKQTSRRLQPSGIFFGERAREGDWERRLQLCTLLCTCCEMVHLRDLQFVSLDGCLL